MNNDADYIVIKRKLNKNKTTKSKAFEYKTNLREKISANNNKLDTKVVAFFIKISE